MRFLRHIFTPEVRKRTVIAMQCIRPQTIPLIQDILIYCKTKKKKAHSNKTISIGDGMSRFLSITLLDRFPAARPEGFCSLQKSLVPTLPAFHLFYVSILRYHFHETDCVQMFCHTITWINLVSVYFLTYYPRNFASSMPVPHFS